MSSPNTTPPSLILSGKEGIFAGRRFTAAGYQLIIGRETGCQIQIDAPGVSRRHARISYTGSGWMIEDLGSSNGTFVNGQRITQPQPVATSDVVAFGSQTFIFFQSSVASASAATLVEGIDLQATQIEPLHSQVPPPQPPMAAPPIQSPVPSVQPLPQYQPSPPQYQPPPQYQAAPPPYQPPPSPYYTPMQPYLPPRRSGCSPCLWISLAVLLLGCIGSVIAILILGIPVMSILRDPGSILQLINNNGGLNITGSDLITITSGQNGMVSLPNGASIFIPAGSVPPTESGQAGSMSFSLRQVEDQTVTLPGEFKAVGPVYELGPEGFTFTTPVTVTLPIPAGVDPETVLGMTYLDSGDNSWKLVPAAVDAQARTVTVMTTHFSLWSIFGEPEPNWRPKYGGWFSISNNHRYNSGEYPGGRRLAMSVTYGVCIQSYSLDNPNDEWMWYKPYEWQMTVSDYRGPFAGTAPQTQKWWLLSGTYNLIEVVFMSEVNNSPLYVPQYTTFYRPLGIYRLEKGQTIDFNYGSQSVTDGTFTEGRPPCYGIEDTSVGTGDVQITLTWQKGVDLDLHVIDPNGDEIYFEEPVSSSGGTLDRDNRCNDMVVGRPENIYWPQGNAPKGTYKIRVYYYEGCGAGGPVSYTVRTVVKGVAKTYSGTINPGAEINSSFQDVATFTIP